MSTLAEPPKGGRVIRVAAPADDELPEMPSFVPDASRPRPAPALERIEVAVKRLAIDAARPGDVEAVLAAGGLGLEGLMHLFPGQLRFDRYAVDPRTVKPSAHSALIGAVIRFGPRAAPRLEAMLDHLSPELRYYAACCFLGIHQPASARRVAALLFDNDQAVRQMAATVLDAYRDEAAFDDAAHAVRRALLDAQPARRRMAMQAAGALRLSGLVPTLVDLLIGEDPALAEAAHRCLVEITWQDFYDHAPRWRAWFEQHGEAPRIEWLLEGLAHERQHVRQGAARELERLTFQTFGFRPDAPPGERRASVERWVAWWDTRGRFQYGDYR